MLAAMNNHSSVVEVLVDKGAAARIDSVNMVSASQSGVHVVTTSVEGMVLPTV